MASKSIKVNESQLPKPEQVEEAWFADRGRETKRPLRTSPTTPPPPIGDELADKWFR
jgi:hypothetical protein